MWVPFDHRSMATDSDESTSKVVVQAYLPEYQREEWDAHAEELEMSRSEFVKAMVQAGRRGFEGESEPERSTELPPDDAVSGDEIVTQSTESLEETVIETLATEEYLSWDELLAAVTDDIESRLETTLQELQSDDRIRYSGRHGGYTLDK